MPKWNFESNLRYLTIWRVSQKIPHYTHYSMKINTIIDAAAFLLTWYAKKWILLALSDLNHSRRVFLSSLLFGEWNIERFPLFRLSIAQKIQVDQYVVIYLGIIKYTKSRTFINRFCVVFLTSDRYSTFCDSINWQCFNRLVKRNRLKIDKDIHRS